MRTTIGTQRIQNARHIEYKTVISQIHQRTQLRNRSTMFRDRQRLHALRSAEVHWRIIYHSPAGRVDLDHTPFRIANVEINAAFMLGDTQKDLALLAVESGMSAKGPDRRLHRREARSFLHLHEKLMQQPVREFGAGQWPSVTVAIDHDISIRDRC